MLNMTQVFAPPSVAPKTDRQALANDNLNMFMAASGTKRKDLAAYIGKDPAMITNLLKGKNRWFYEDMLAAADYFGISLDTLQRDDLTPSKVRAILDGKNGGLPVVNVDDFRLRGGAWKTPAIVLAA